MSDDKHAGTPVTWERLRTAHSGMLGEQPWAPLNPNEGHRMYRQQDGEQCYMCAALWLIDEARKENESLKSDNEALRKALDNVRGYAVHLSECSIHNGRMTRKCDCGIGTALLSARNALFQKAKP